VTPKRLSHFELLDELGAGGMGVVYRARDLKLNRLVAVKVLPAAAQGDGERRRFLAEAQAASGINHPAVVTIHEVDSDGGVDFIAMELVEGRSLAVELRHGALPIGRALRLAIAVADGLAAAHRFGLVHRDLKPGNLMVGPGDRVKILDFGLVKRIEATGEIAADSPTAVAPESLTASGLLVGTPAYMSPEQARGETVDARSDLFAFGCVLYEMLTGRRAFAGENPVQVLSGVLGGEPAPAGGLPAELTALLGRLLAKDSASRPKSAEAVGRELEAIAGTLAGSAPTMVAAAGPRRRPALRLALAALLAATALAVGVFVATRPPSEPNYEFRLVSQTSAAERRATFAPDGNSLAFVREDAAGVPQLWIRSLAGGDVLQLTRGQEAVTTADWSPAGDRILFALEGGGIWEIPPLGGTPRRLIEDGTKPRLSADGRRLVFVSERRLWTAGGDGRDAQPIAGVEPVNFGHLAEAAFSPDGETIAYFWPHPRRPLGDLWRVPAGGGTPERLTDLGFFGGGLDWTPDGRGIVFAADHDGPRTLWRVSASGGAVQPITRGAGEDSHPRVSHDGRRLVYTNQRNLHSIERTDPASGRRQRALERRDAIFLPRLSHAGDRVAFFARVPRAHHLFVLELDSGRVEQITRGDGELNTHPRWSSNDRALYYYREDPEWDLRRIELASGADEVVSPEWTWPTHQFAALSPGDREIAYLVRDAGRFVETRIRSRATGAERTLPVALWALEWFADGRRLLGASADDRIHICDADERSCEEICSGQYPLLSADGAWIYLLRFPGPVAWRRELASGREEQLAELEGYVSLSFNWSVRPNGELVWNRFEPGREELWLGELR